MKVWGILLFFSYLLILRPQVLPGNPLGLVFLCCCLLFLSPDMKLLFSLCTLPRQARLLPASSLDVGPLMLVSIQQLTGHFFTENS